MISRLIGLLAAKLLSPLVSFIVVIAIARISGAETLGQYSTVLVWLVLFQHLSIFGISEYISREIGADRRETETHLVHGLLLAEFFAVLSGSLMIAGACYFEYPDAVKRAIVMASLSLPFTASILVCQSVFTAFERIKYVAAATVVENALILLGGSVVILRGYGLFPLIASLVLARVIAAAFNIQLVHRRIARIQFKMRPGVLRKMLPTVFVFGLTGIAFQVFMRIDVVMLSRMSDMVSVGLYSSSAKLMELSLMVPLVFYFLNLPAAAEDYRRSGRWGSPQMQAGTEAYFMLIICMVGFSLLFADAILGLLYGQAFIGASTVFRLLTLSFLIHSTEITLEIACQTAGYQAVALRIALLRATVNVILNLVCIPLWGAVGAAIATLASITVSFALFQHFVTTVRVGYEWARMMAKPAAICLVISIALFPLAEHFTPLVLAPLFVSGYAVLMFASSKIRLERFKIVLRGERNE